MFYCHLRLQVVYKPGFLLKLKSEDQIVEQQRPHVPEYFEQGWKQKEGDLWNVIDLNYGSQKLMRMNST